MAAVTVHTDYPFTRNDLDAEIKRLNHHHDKVWVPLAGKLAPTHILDHLKRLPSPRVADIATGTGVWVNSLAKELSPEARLWGFDLDVSKIRPSMSTPNVSFEQHNVLDPFPEELHGTFDLVHVRLLVLALTADEWDVAIRHTVSLLRPGGWLFWEELPQPSVRMIPPSKHFEEWWRTHMLYSTIIGRDPVSPYRLQSKFARAGLVDCDEKVWSTWCAEGVSQVDVSMVLLRCVRPILSVVVEGGGMETVQTMEDVTRVEDSIKEDLQEGAQLGFDFLWAMGRKK